MVELREHLDRVRVGSTEGHCASWHQFKLIHKDTDVKKHTFRRTITNCVQESRFKQAARCTVPVMLKQTPDTHTHTHLQSAQADSPLHAIINSNRCIVETT